MAYVCAWNEKPEAAYLKGMYFLTKLDPELSMKDRCRELLASQDTEGWDREFNEALAQGPDRRDLRYGSRKFSTGIRKKMAGGSRKGTEPVEAGIQEDAVKIP